MTVHHAYYDTEPPNQYDFRPIPMRDWGKPSIQQINANCGDMGCSDSAQATPTIPIVRVERRVFPTLELGQLLRRRAPQLEEPAAQTAVT